ncbi:replicative DNA helicase [Novimethylophilus kurashikiensis]|uniref:Replicative DNA helicase n=1 Tax=Novimethylophilus kurashikiensis TaxID=1825523 RepID=A0A2R5F8D4_9PROT|nr:TrbC family F-type conjugative pilus assembly protein [Novimethylophilus kurashikiensis]GBG14510.1 replicative DNA helicase [Novimethylophilus kurashikiensis]
MKPSSLTRAVILAASLGLPMAALADTEAATAKMQAIMKGDVSQLPEATQKAIASVEASTKAEAEMNNVPQSVIDFSIEQSAKLRQQALQSYVKALPPKDQAFGAQVLLGDGSIGGGYGKFYFFVSRSMPVSLLKAYSLAALNTGGTLVMLGVRKGDTIKEYMDEVVEDFNNADGQVLGGIELNPNLFDMFDVKVVPSVVWSNRMNLDDIGSGCEDAPGAQAQKLTLQGPDDEPLVVDKPVCAKAKESTYFKISGALNINYVLERFKDAGAPAEVIQHYQDLLADQHGNVNDRNQAVQVTGNAITPIKGDLHIDSLPKHVLQHWQEELATKHVMRGPYGPVFSEDGKDDVIYRKELAEKVAHGLGL